MKTTSTIILIWMALLLFPACGNINTVFPEHEVAVLLLGDSITEGAPHSYRHSLWKRLINAGMRFTFIGSQEDATSYWVHKGEDWNGSHEGHASWTFRHANDKIGDLLENYLPEIVLIHLGTNDIPRIIAPEFPTYTLEQTILDLRGLVEKLRDSNPSVTIYLAKILPMYGNGEIENKTVDLLNLEIEAMAALVTTEASPIIVVDMNADFDESDLVDGVHPDKGGAKKMARNWADAILSSY